MTPIQTNKPVFFDDAGDVLEGGQIYIGQPSTDPRTNQKTVTLRDSGGSEFTAQQPLKTVAGRISYNGKPIVALVDGEYSMLILDAAGKQLDYSRSINAAGTEGGGGIADFSEVTRVGLTLNDVKAFDVAVGDVVRSVGNSSATDGEGAQWLSISSTGVSGDDENIIDFNNGLQGRRIGPPKHVIIYEQSAPGAISVPLSSLDSADQASGQFAVRVNLYRADGSTFGSFWVPLSIVSTAHQASCQGGETVSYRFSVFYSGSDRDWETYLL
jgi:hypothetical protein